MVFRKMFSPKTLCVSFLRFHIIIKIVMLYNIIFVVPVTQLLINFGVTVDIVFIIKSILKFSICKST